MLRVTLTVVVVVVGGIFLYCELCGVLCSPVASSYHCLPLLLCRAGRDDVWRSVLFGLRLWETGSDSVSEGGLSLSGIGKFRIRDCT